MVDLQLVRRIMRIRCYLRHSILILRHGGRDELGTGINEQVLVSLLTGLNFGQLIAMFLPDSIGNGLVDEAVGGTGVGDDGEEGDHAIVELGVLLGTGDFLVLARLEASAHGGANAPEDAGGVLVSTEHEVGYARVVGHANGRSEDGVDDFLCCHGFGVFVGSTGWLHREGGLDGGEGCEGGGVVSQQAFETAEGEGGEDGKVLESGGGI
mmetsp:Transcript_9656/g.14219  ORF Transcript_9656/g.14219 Transcript_9656/m.14219 type:complete len:210 (+) Transcript_9656:499-1128(+)